MAKDKGTPQQEEIAQRNAGISSGRTSGSVAATGTSESATDRERTIQTGREGQRAQFGSLGRSAITPTIYEAGATPFSVMRRMVDDMDRLFDSVALTRSSWSPQVETFRRGENLVIRADLPGLRKEDVNVEIDNDVLTISGERRDEHEEDRDGFYRSERTYGQFYRAVPLPEDVSEDQIEASFQNGVLEVTLPVPKQTESQRKRIQVR